MIKKLAIVVALASVFVLTAHAANNALDVASNSPYGGAHGWQNGDNGGFGFGSWIFSNPGGNGATGGMFIGSSSGNAGGASGNIDTAGVSWGMYANSGVTTAAVRPFTGGSLGIGQELDLRIDNGFLSSGSSEGFGLQTTGGVNRLEFFFSGGSGSYTLTDNSGSNPTGIGFTGNGLSIAFTLTSADTYTMDVTPNGGGTTVLNGTLEGVAGTGIDQMRFFDFNGGNGQGSNGDFFVNQLEVVPEPSTIAAGVLAVVGVLSMRRRGVKKTA
jgi:hypothetical protein